MKILHIAALGNVQKNLGVLNQMSIENEFYHSDHNWDVLLLHVDGKTDHKFCKKPPLLFRNKLLIRLFQLLEVLRVHKKYDFIIIRKIPMDFFTPLALIFLDKKISYISHTKDVEMMKDSSFYPFLNFIEVAIKKIFYKKLKFIFSVTNELNEYDSKYLNKNCKRLVIPNGISSAKRHIANNRDKNDINIGFMASNFFQHQGLEDFVVAMKAYQNLSKKINLHIAGRLTNYQENLISNNKNIFLYDTTSLNKEKFYAKLDIVLGPLRTDIIGLNELSSLKAKEALSFGVPVYAGCPDVSFDNEFPFYEYGDINVQKIVDLATSFKDIDKNEIYDLSAKYINKNSIQEKIIYEINSL